MKFDIDDLNWDVNPTPTTATPANAMASHLAASQPAAHNFDTAFQYLHSSFNDMVPHSLGAHMIAQHQIQQQQQHHFQPRQAHTHQPQQIQQQQQQLANSIFGSRNGSSSLASIAEHSRLATSAPVGIKPEAVQPRAANGMGNGANVANASSPEATSSNGDDAAPKEKEEEGAEELSPEELRKKKPHLCEVCGVSFARKVHLQRHSLRHNTCKPYRCEQCGKCFSRQDSLVRHHRLLHERDSSRHRGSKSRERAAKTCMRCLQFKIPCDGGAPCGLCMENGIGPNDCVMAPAKVTRRSRSNSSRGAEFMMDEDEVGSDVESRRPMSSRSYIGYMEAEGSGGSGTSNGSAALDDRQSIYSASYGSSSAFSPGSFQSASAMLGNFEGRNGAANQNLSMSVPSQLDPTLLHGHNILPTSPLHIQTGFFGDLTVHDHPHSAHPALGGGQPHHQRQNPHQPPYNHHQHSASQGSHGSHMAAFSMPNDVSSSSSFSTSQHQPSSGSINGSFASGSATPLPNANQHHPPAMATVAAAAAAAVGANGASDPQHKVMGFDHSASAQPTEAELMNFDWDEFMHGGTGHKGAHGGNSNGHHQGAHDTNLDPALLTLSGNGDSKASLAHPFIDAAALQHLEQSGMLLSSHGEVRQLSPSGASSGGDQSSTGTGAASGSPWSDGFLNSNNANGAAEGMAMR